MNRYLLHISYIGTHFKAFTKSKASGKYVIPTTVGVIEEALKEVKPRNPIQVKTISRTDTGTHAINSAVVVDLERKNGQLYDCDHITCMLNRSFESSAHNIRINRTELVPNTFNQHINAVKSRTYLYRLGIMKSNADIDYRLEEKERCFFMKCDNFDIQRLKEAAQMFVGWHDFRTFMTINNDIHRQPSYTKRRINYVNVEQSHAHTVQPFEHANHVDYWNITFNAQSFLYRQIRRIVGTLVAVANGKLSQRELYEMLTIPSQGSFNNKVNVAPPNGLYLANIEFRPKCFLPVTEATVNASKDHSQQLKVFKSSNSECIKIDDDQVQ